MTTWIHRCVSLQCCCLEPSGQPEKASVLPFPLARPPSSPHFFLDDVIQRQMDRTRRPCSLPRVGTTCQIHGKVTVNLVRPLLSGTLSAQRLLIHPLGHIVLFLSEVFTCSSSRSWRWHLLIPTFSPRGHFKLRRCGRRCTLISINGSKLTQLCHCDGSPGQRLAQTPEFGSSWSAVLKVTPSFPVLPRLLWLTSGKKRFFNIF